MPRQQRQTRGIEEQSALTARVRGGRGTPLLLREGELLVLLQARGVLGGETEAGNGDGGRRSGREGLLGRGT